MRYFPHLDRDAIRLVGQNAQRPEGSERRANHGRETSGRSCRYRRFQNQTWTWQADQPGFCSKQKWYYCNCTPLGYTMFLHPLSSFSLEWRLK